MNEFQVQMCEQRTTQRITINFDDFQFDYFKIVKKDREIKISNSEEFVAVRAFLFFVDLEGCSGSEWVKT